MAKLKHNGFDSEDRILSLQVVRDGGGSALFFQRNTFFHTIFPSTRRAHRFISIAAHVVFTESGERARVYLNLGTVYRGQNSWGFWCASFDAPCKSLRTSIELHHQRRVQRFDGEDVADMHGTWNELWRWNTMFEIDSNASTETRKSTSQVNCELWSKHTNNCNEEKGHEISRRIKLTTKYLAIRHNRTKSSCIK